MTEQRRWLLATWVVIIAAAIVRIPRLGWSLFLDEIWVVEAIRGGVFVPHDITQPPLFFFSLLATVKAFGSGDVALRIPAFLFGIALTLVPLLLRDRIKPLALFTWTTLLAFSSPIVFYSARAKQYTLDATMSALLVVLCMRAASDRTGRALAWYFAAAFVCALTMHGTLFALTGCGVALLLVAVTQRDWRFAAMVAAGHLVALLLFVAAYLAYMKPGPHAIGGDLESYFALRHQFFDGKTAFLTHQTAHWLGQGLNLARGFVALAAISLVVVAVRLRHDPATVALLAAAVVAPLACLTASGLHRYPYGEVRLMIFAMPAVFLVMALALAELPRAPIVAAVLLGYFAWQQLAHDPYNATYMRTWDLGHEYALLRADPQHGTPLLTRQDQGIPLLYYAPSLKDDVKIVPDGVPLWIGAPEFRVFAGAREPLDRRCRVVWRHNDAIIARCRN